MFCVHQYLQVRHGIINQENLNTSVLVDAGVYEFAYIYNPVPIVGATGSIGSAVSRNIQKNTNKKKCTWNDASTYVCNTFYFKKNKTKICY